MEYYKLNQQMRLSWFCECIKMVKITILWFGKKNCKLCRGFKTDWASVFDKILTQFRFKKNIVTQLWISTNLMEILAFYIEITLDLKA